MFFLLSRFYHLKNSSWQDCNCKKLKKKPWILLLLYFIYSILHSYQPLFSSINLRNVSECKCEHVTVSVRMPLVMSVLARAKECREYQYSLEKKNYFFSCCFVFFSSFLQFLWQIIYTFDVCVCEWVISQYFFNATVLFCYVPFCLKKQQFIQEMKSQFTFSLTLFFFSFLFCFALGVIIGFPYNFCWFCCFGYFLLPVFSVQFNAVRLLLCLFSYE